MMSMGPTTKPAMVDVNLNGKDSSCLQSINSGKLDNAEYDNNKSVL